MSGPKVVRIVTREELLAAGESLLHRLNATFTEWEQASIRAGSSVSDIQSTKARRDALEAALRQDKFGEFGVKAVAEIDFLESDAARRLQSAAQTQARERARVGNGREIAASLLRGNGSFHENVRAKLEDVAAGKLGISDIDAVLSSAIASLHKTESTGLSDQQRSVASRLGAAEIGRSFEEWKADQLQSDPRVQKLGEQIAEIELLGDVATASVLRSQLEHVLSVDSSAERQLRLDSIQITSKKAREVGVCRNKLLKTAKLLGAELGAFGEATVAQTRELDAFSAISDIDSIEGAVAAASKLLGVLQAERAYASRRQAVLDGLNRLGYVVNEGLATGTSSSGKIVVRSPENANYGVEIVGAGTSDRLQVRSVAFSSDRNISGDIPAEQTWCGDFSKLKSVLTAQGCEVVVEKAMGIGVVPLKVVEISNEDERRRASTPSTSRRSAN